MIHCSWRDEEALGDFGVGQSIMIASPIGVAGCGSQAVDDSAITLKVKSKLAADSQTSAIKIGVETKDAVVTLSLLRFG